MRRWLLFPLIMLAFRAYAAEPVSFQVVPAESAIRFEVLRDGKALAGNFQNFTAAISFHPEALAASQVEVVVETGAVRIESSDAQGMITDKEWLATKSFPQAKFVTESFKSLGGNRYEASAKLTLKEVTLPLIFTFTLDEFSASAAKITGEAILKRNDFKIGWANTDSVSDQVKVRVALKAISKAP